MRKRICSIIMVLLIFSNLFPCFSINKIVGNASNTIEDIISVAENEIGNTYYKYTSALWPITGSDGKATYIYSWCAAFTSYCTKQAGISGIAQDTRCKEQYYNSSGEKHWVVSDKSYVPKPGDLIYFDWNCTGSSSKNFDHVGIVEWYDSSSRIIHTIEGNADDDNGNGSTTTRIVRRKSRSYNNTVKCFLTPNYEGTYVPPEPDGELGIDYPRPSGNSCLKVGSRGDYVSWLQTALNRAIGAGLVIDGDFGSATETAVKNFQEKNRETLDVDGEAGPLTISKLVEVLKSMMQPSTCTIFFNANGGSCGTGEKIVTIGSNYGDLPDASRTGYSFAGWFDENGSNISSGSYVSRSDNHTLYAHWNQNQYTVWFDGNGGDADWNSKTVVYDGTYGDLPNAGRTGYTFAGWFDEWGNGISSNTAMTRADNHTLYAYWNQNQYTIYFDGNDGNVDLGDKTVTYDGTYGDLPNAGRTGYTFTGWFDEWGNSISSDTAMTRADNHTLYAHWQANPVTVWLNPNNGEVSQENIQFFYEQNYTDLPQAVRTGYNFNGWYTAADGGSLVDANTIVSQTEEHTLYANWSKDKFLITFDARGGTSEAASKLVAYDNLYGVLPSAEKSGYIFEGWYFDEQCTIPLTSDTVVQITANQTFYAKWALRQYLLTFDANGGSTDAQNKKVTFGKNYGVLPVPEKSGCRFAGWFTETGIEITSDNIVQIDSDMTVVAKWLICGDINANDDIDVRDLVILQRYLHNKRKFSETEFYVSDLNQDGIVNVFDLALLKRILIKK